MVQSSTVMMQETQQKIFDFAPGLAAMTESSTVDSDGEKELLESTDDSDSDWDGSSWPRLSEAALLTHTQLMESRKGQMVDSESEAGSISTDYFSAHSKEEFATDSDGTSSQSSFMVSDTESEPCLPLGPHGPGECQPCAFFAKGICARGSACSYCHEHAYVSRPITGFRKGSRFLKRSREEASRNMVA
jgi:hypothetical protein